MDFIKKVLVDIDKTNYIFIGGGVASGIGKGIIVSSLAVCLQSAGFSVTTIKIDPYFNIDAGTMNPWEHGEVFILKDGGEVDLDLGNYERYLDQEFTRDHNITSGKVYDNIIRKERKGDYKGKTVQFFPHVAQEIKDLIYVVGNKKMESTGKPPHVVLVELGGTVGDMESIIFYEAIRQIILENEKFRTFFILVSYVPFFPTTGEQKTKPTQNALNALRMTGVTLNWLITRSRLPLEDKQLKKLALFANLKEHQVLNVPDLESINQVPAHLEKNDLPYHIMEHFKFPLIKCQIDIYQKLHEHIENVISKKDPLQLAVVGKYVGIEDSYLSIKKAIESAAIAADTPVEIVWVKSEELEETFKETNKESYAQAWAALRSVKCIVIPGGFDLRGLEGKIAAVKYARENNIPILGICYGFQSMCIEYARNVMGEKRATTFEISLYRAQPMRVGENEKEYRVRLDKDKKLQNKEVYVIEDMDDANLSELGDTMRKGQHKTLIKDKKTLAYKLYNKTEFYERYRHRFEVALDWLDKFQKGGLIFSAFDESGKRMEMLELPKHKYFVGVQFHPEFQSRNFKPSPPFLGLIKAALGTLQNDLKKNKKLTTDYYWAADSVEKINQQSKITNK